MDKRAVANVLGLYLLYRKRKQRRRPLVRPYMHVHRSFTDEHQRMLNDIWTREGYNVDHQNFRFDTSLFFDLMNRLKPRLTHVRSHRQPIGVAERLAMTLKILATGSSQMHIAQKYRFGKSTVNVIFHETCKVIWEVLSTDFVKSPNKDDYERISKDFSSLYNFPNCVGAIGCRHITIRNPPKDADDSSFVLFVAVDARHAFTDVSIVPFGGELDSGTFLKSDLGKSLCNASLDLPSPKALPGTDVTLPFFFIGDETLPLEKNLTRPYSVTSTDPERLAFNRRLDHAQKVLEATFGVLSARWRVLSKPLDCKMEKVESIVKATIALHNFFLTTTHGSSDASNQYMPSSLLESLPSICQSDSNLFSVSSSRSNMASDSGRRVRDQLCSYFCSNPSPGEVISTKEEPLQ